MSKLKREEIPIPNILKLFCFFILACGFTHFIDMILFWQPVYNLSVLVKLLTAAISFTTLIALFNIFPQLMLYKSPHELQRMVTLRTATLNDTNQQLLDEIARRQKIENELNQSLALNEHMFKEIHHRIKNNLQAISSIIYLKSQTMGEEGKNILKGVNDRINGISHVHEMLLHSGSLSNIQLNHYLEDLTQHLMKSITFSKKVETRLNVDPSIIVTTDIATNCGLIVSECFHNSIKHAVTDSLVIFSITARLNMENVVELLIEDNGQGFDLPESKSPLVHQFGLSLVKTFVKAINGTISIHSKDKTEFKITFPIK